MGLEDELGSLSPGKRADVALLSADPTSVPPEAIKEIRVEATFLDGQAVYGG